jgi:hypothetical protein
MAAIWRDGLVKSYVEGRVNIECVVIVDQSPRKWKLVFAGIENGIKPLKFSGRSAVVSNVDIGASVTDGNDLCMCRISELVQSPEFAISSLVWLEPFKDGDDRGGDILADFSPGNQVIEIFDSVRDWELSFFKSSVSRQFGSNVGALIEGGTGGLKNLHGEMSPGIREREGKLEFVGFGAAIRLVRLTDDGGWMFIAVFPNCRVQFGNLFFRAR